MTESIQIFEPDAASLDAATIEKLFAKTARTVAVDPLCAAQVAVARNGKLAAFASFGRAPFGGEEREAGPDSLFALYSCTKAIVSSASWIQLQAKKLALSDRVADYIPEFGCEGKEAVTVEQLLTHTAGFPSAQLDPLDWEDPERRVAGFAKWRLEWEPGTRFVYHGGATMLLLAELIARTSGKDYRDFIHEQIFAPLGLRDLFVGLPDSEHGRVANVIQVGEPMTDDERAVSPVDAPVIGANLLDFANSAERRRISSPGGGAIGTAASLALFYQGILQDAEGSGAGIWRKETIADALTARNVDLIDAMTKHPALRGLGVVMAGESGRMWRGFCEENSAQAFGHMGAGGQVAWADPATGISFAYCTNGAQQNPARQGATGFQLSTLAAKSAR